MDFFDRQARAKRQTNLLLVLFTAAVVVVVCLIYFLIASLVWIFQHPILPQTRWNPFTILLTGVFYFGGILVQPIHSLKMIWNPQLAPWIALGTLASIAAGCIYKIHLLSEGGSAVAELLGGRRVDENTRDANEKMLRDAVEEMAIASGMPTPKIYVLDRERGINSFAAGHARDDVAICITFAALKLLTRDELQGVIAHEFSHVLNGDTRLNMKLMGLVHGLFWPTIVGRILLRGTSEAPEMGGSIFDEDLSEINKPLIPLAYLFLFFGSISSPLVRLIKSLISRQREWLADAAAVQFTRNPAGIESVLKKVGGLLKQGRLDTAHAESASHFYFVNCRHEPWFGFQSTHPPLVKRILALDPNFDGKFQHIHSLESRDAFYDYVYEKSLQRLRAEAAAREAQE